MPTGIPKGKKRLTDEERKANIKASIEKWSKSEKGSAKNKAYKQTRKYKAQQKTYRQTPEARAKAKVSRARPEARAKANARQRVQSAKPETNLKNRKKYQDNKSEILAKSKVVREDLKKEVFSEYSKRHSRSKTPCCRCCGENFDIDFLSVDHIDGRAHLTKDEKHLKGNPLNVWIKKNNFPEGLQILCQNCNMAKGMKKNNNKCPHEK
jgi:hypothetical protein